MRTLIMWMTKALDWIAPRVRECEHENRDLREQLKERGDTLESHAHTIDEQIMKLEAAQNGKREG